MYEIFQRLLIEKGITAYRVAKETGIPQSTFTCWKNGVYSPKDEKMKKIADYLGVSVEYLRTGQDQKEKSDTDPGDELKNLDSTSKSKLIVLARHLDKVPDAQRERLLKNFEESIDIYLDAMGIPKEDK